MTYTDLLLTTHPLAYWPMNDPAGATAAKDISGNGHDATVLGTVTLGAPGLISGEADTACQLTAPNGLIQLPALSVKPPFSLSGLFKPTGDGGLNKGFGTFFGYGGEGDTNNRIIWRDTSNAVEVEMGGAVLVSTVPVPTGTVHHFVYVTDGATETMYIDGQAAGSQANTKSAWMGSPTYIGGYGPVGGSYELSGTVEKCAVHAVALDAATIASLAQAALNPNPGVMSAFTWNGSAYEPAKGMQVFVGPTQPASPNLNAVWIQTS